MIEAMLVLSSGILGVVAGAVVTLVGSYFQQKWSFAKQLQERQEQARVDLVREIMRYRLDQERLIGPLNEIPLVFGDDHDALRLYRETLNSTSSVDRTRTLSDLINRLATLVGLPSSVQASDMQRGFQYGR